MIDLSQILMPIGTFLGGGGLVALVSAYKVKREHDTRNHVTDVDATKLAINTIVQLLKDEQTAHNRTRDRLSAMQTESDLRGGQVGDLGARVEMLSDSVVELRAEVSMLDKKNDDCEERNAHLTKRVHALERDRTTPANDTPAVGGPYAR